MEQEQSQEKRSRWINALVICGILIWIAVVVMVIRTVGVSSGNGSSWVEIYTDDPFIEERENQFKLSQRIPKYDKVISAIEAYQVDHGSYPEQLSDLIPSYLEKEPGLYIRSAEYLLYEAPVNDDSLPAFNFLVRGHYPGLAFMHGWELMYCPDTYSGCAEGGDRHIWAYRVNSRWIWISSSAL